MSSSKIRLATYKIFRKGKVISFKAKQHGLQPYSKFVEQYIYYKLFKRFKARHFSYGIVHRLIIDGLGACTSNESTHGWWSEADKVLHINILELKAIYNGLQCFATNCENCNILIRTDNTTAMSYINRMGSVQHTNLNNITKDIWHWCQEKNIFLVASYISSKDNWKADRESRILSTETEWSLSLDAFDKITKNLGVPEIDLFASSINYKCQRFVS